MEPVNAQECSSSSLEIFRELFDMDTLSGVKDLNSINLLNPQRGGDPHGPVLVYSGSLPFGPSLRARHQATGLGRTFKHEYCLIVTADYLLISSHLLWKYQKKEISVSCHKLVRYEYDPCQCLQSKFAHNLILVCTVHVFLVYKFFQELFGTKNVHCYSCHWQLCFLMF